MLLLLVVPQVVWAQLMSEQRSRINACLSKDLDIYRCAT
jgi:hypothetical protein